MNFEFHRSRPRIACGDVRCHSSFIIQNSKLGLIRHANQTRLHRLPAQHRRDRGHGQKPLPQGSRHRQPGRNRRSVHPQHLHRHRHRLEEVPPVHPSASQAQPGSESDRYRLSGRARTRLARHPRRRSGGRQRRQGRTPGDPRPSGMADQTDERRNEPAPIAELGLGRFSRSRTAATTLHLLRRHHRPRTGRSLRLRDHHRDPRCSWPSATARSFSAASTSVRTATTSGTSRGLEELVRRILAKPTCHACDCRRWSRGTSTRSSSRSSATPGPSPPPPAAAERLRRHPRSDGSENHGPRVCDRLDAAASGHQPRRLHLHRRHGRIPGRDRRRVRRVHRRGRGTRVLQAAHLPLLAPPRDAGRRTCQARCPARSPRKGALDCTSSGTGSWIGSPAVRRPENGRPLGRRRGDRWSATVERI
jgi:hypothetical protein